MKRVLLTGAAGFIGSHCLDHLLVNTDWHIVATASFRHKGVPERIVESEHYQAHKERVTFIYHDLCSPFTAMERDQIGHIDYIINFAAESHVDRSITDPVTFVRNNVDVMLSILEFAREAKPEVFVQISTDEVYGAAPKGHAHAEWEPIIPSNPYSASKAAQEALAISYWRTYSIPLIITNTMNNIGERQDPEKFFPMVVRKVLRGEKVTIHGRPDMIGSRFYLHARNHADAILWLLENRPPHMFPDVDRPDRYNVVGEQELNNLEVAEHVATILNKPLNYELLDFHSARPGHDPRYALDGSKIGSLGWKPPMALDLSMMTTIQWTLDHPKWLDL